MLKYHMSDDTGHGDPPPKNPPVQPPPKEEKIEGIGVA